MTDVSKLSEVRKSFVTIVRQKEEMDTLMWELIKHPAATGVQITEARQALLGMEEPLRRVVTALRKKYPYPTIGMATRPWHREEFDRYMEVKDGI